MTSLVLENNPKFVQHRTKICDQKCDQICRKLNEKLNENILNEKLHFFVSCKLKKNAMKFDEMIKKRLKYDRMQTKYDSTQ